jgi:hypothetical protein
MHAVWIFVLGLLSPGCAVVCASVDTVAYKTKECFMEHEERSRNWKWAEVAWRDVCRANPHTPCSRHFAEGFKTGYAEYLYAGEPGTPPALPPRQYRGVAFQTPAGYRVIEDWFAGFRYGVVVARSEGYRDLIIGPTSLSEPPMPGPPPVPQLADTVHEPAEKPLPPPRPVQAPVLQFQLPTLGAAPRPTEAPLSTPTRAQGPVLEFQLPARAGTFKPVEAPLPTPGPAQGAALRLESLAPSAGVTREAIVGEPPSTEQFGSAVLRLETPEVGTGRESTGERPRKIGEMPAPTQ